MQLLSRALLVLALSLAVLVEPNNFGLAGGEEEVDRAVHAALRDVINHGADLFNDNGDHAGCYRAYEGGLLAVKPLLKHHPDLQKTIDDGVADAARQTRVIDRAFALRKVIDTVRTKLKTTAETTAPTKTVVKELTLWERLDGAKRLPTVIEGFVEDVTSDPRIDMRRTGKMKIDVAKVKAAVLAFIGKKAGASMASNAKSFKDALEADHLQDYEFNLAVATFKERLKAAGISDADANVLLSSIEVSHQPVTVIPIPPTPRVETPPVVKPAPPKSQPMPPKVTPQPPVKPVEPKPPVKAVEPIPQPKPQPEPKAVQPKPPVKVEPIPEPKPQPEPKAVQPKPPVKVEPIPEPKPQPEPKTVQPKPPVKVEPIPEPKPQPEPKAVQPKPPVKAVEPIPEPKPQPELKTVQPKPPVKAVEPIPEPKPQPEPKTVQPKPPVKTVEPIPDPKPEPKKIEAGSSESRLLDRIRDWQIANQHHPREHAACSMGDEALCLTRFGVF